MAIRSICDTCKKESELTVHGLTADGWFAVRERGRYDGLGDKDYCSRTCAITGLGGTVPGDQAAPSDAEQHAPQVGART